MARSATAEKSQYQAYTGKKRVRSRFGKIADWQIPNLIEVQKNSYNNFLQMVTPNDQRNFMGLQEVFKTVFPIRDSGGRAELDFVSYEFDTPKYDVDECITRGLTFAAPLRVTLRLSVFDVEEDTGLRLIRDIKEQDVYMGDIPLMTDKRYFHRQRHRARDRLANAPLTWRCV